MGTDRPRVGVRRFEADVAQLVEHSFGKLRRFGGVSEAGAASRNPERSEGARAGSRQVISGADVAQLVEHSLGKGEVTSSILVIGSRKSASSC